MQSAYHEVLAPAVAMSAPLASQASCLEEMWVLSAGREADLMEMEGVAQRTSFRSALPYAYGQDGQKWKDATSNNTDTP
jgi:hypothetical protein